MTATAAASSVRPLLSVSGVSVRFGGIVALDGVSLEVAPGQVCGLIGPNGAGKSTLFNCVSRLYGWQEGSIEFDGHDLSRLPRHRMAGVGIGRTFQNLALYRSLSVRDNVLVGCHSHHDAGFLRNALRTPEAARRERAATERADRLIDFLDLGAVAHRLVSELPFGTQKRVEMGRALAAEPKLLLLDEPASGLNHEEVDALAGLIREVVDRMGITVLLVEHHMGLVMGVSERVVALNFGKKIAEGTPAEVRTHPDVIHAYLGQKKAAAQDRAREAA